MGKNTRSGIQYGVNGNKAAKASKYSTKPSRLSDETAQLADKTAQLTDETAQLADETAQLDSKAAQLDAKAAQLDAKAAQLDAKAAQLDDKKSQLEAMQAQLEATREQLEDKSLKLEDDTEYVKSVVIGMTLAQDQFKEEKADFDENKEHFITGKRYFDEFITLFYKKVDKLTQERDTFTQERDRFIQERDGFIQERYALAQERDELAQEKKKYKTKQNIQSKTIEFIKSEHSEAIAKLQGENNTLCADLVKKESKLLLAYQFSASILAGVFLFIAGDKAIATSVLKYNVMKFFKKQTVLEFFNHKNHNNQPIVINWAKSIKCANCGVYSHVCILGPIITKYCLNCMEAVVKPCVEILGNDASKSIIGDNVEAVCRFCPPECRQSY